IGPASLVVPDVLVALAFFAVGMAMFTAPLASLTMSALDDADQGLASGMNNAMGQLAGLLAVVIFPAVAGLGGVSVGGAEFAQGYSVALRAATAIAGAGIVVALVSFGRGRT